jgi:hypothetical protein
MKNEEVNTVPYCGFCTSLRPLYLLAAYSLQLEAVFTIVD